MVTKACQMSVNELTLEQAHRVRDNLARSARVSGSRGYKTYAADTWNIVRVVDYRIAKLEGRTLPTNYHPCPLQA